MTEFLKFRSITSTPAGELALGRGDVQIHPDEIAAFEYAGSMRASPTDPNRVHCTWVYMTSGVRFGIACSTDRLAARLGCAPRVSYKCGVCGTTDETRYQRCAHPGCPDGRDRSTKDGNAVPL